MSREEERDFLLASLDDLDAEHDAGDLDDEDYRALRDDYVARAAEVLRAEQAGGPDPVGAGHGRSLARAAIWIVGVLALAAVSGWWLARSVGARGNGTSLTGSGGTLEERLAECLPLSFQAPMKGSACYDRILAESPDNTEALTYKGWALVRAGKVDDGSKLFDRVVTLDASYPDVHAFRAVVLKDRKDFAGAQAELDTLYSLNPPKGILSTVQQQGLDREVAFGLLSPAVQPCWQKAEDAVQGLSGSQATDAASAKFAQAVTCLQDVTTANPNDLDALEARGYLLGVTGSGLLYPQARTALDSAVTLAPKDPTARLLRAYLRNTMGDPAGALADLDAMAGLGRPSALYVFSGTTEQLRQDLESQLASGASTTIAAPTTISAPTTSR